MIGADGRVEQVLPTEADLTAVLGGTILLGAGSTSM
jgi:hypothetical protein